MIPFSFQSQWHEHPPPSNYLVRQEDFAAQLGLHSAHKSSNMLQQRPAAAMMLSSSISEQEPTMIAQHHQMIPLRYANHGLSYSKEWIKAPQVSSLTAAPSFAANAHPRQLTAGKATRDGLGGRNSSKHGHKERKLPATNVIAAARYDSTVGFGYMGHEQGRTEASFSGNAVQAQQLPMQPQLHLVSGESQMMPTQSNAKSRKQ